MLKKRYSKIWLDALYCTIFTITIAGIFYSLLINVSILNPFTKAFKDFSFTDVYYSKTFFDSKVHRDIIIVNVKHHDRLTIAQAIDNVVRQNPKAIGVDIIFKEQRYPYVDSILKSALNHPNIVTSYFLDNNAIVKNHDYFNNNHENEGYINVNLKNQDAIIRDFVGATIESDTLYSFSSQLAMISGNISKEKVLKRLEDRIPINYSGNEGSFLTFDIEEINDKESIPAINNSIVLFGYLGTPTGNNYDIEDKHFTPLNPIVAGKSIPDMYGIIIHANIIKMLTDENFIKKMPKGLSYFFAIICCFFSVLFGLKLFEKSPFLYDFLIKIVQLVLSIVLLYLALLLLKFNWHIYITPVLVLTLLGLEMVVFYIHLLVYLKKRFKWESHLLD
ncbi:sensor domain CHASE2-containing protein [Lutibacter agarilyticus]|uniref:Sensor domain CHASE2-containing protein n=1 Tax=Lutibacter agarilyticus TaxID=1109740 RepID=A0A238XWX1_9FLAO|nr:CHASE2 domain-containing protein [Lutibacter agarilyticus]SNR62933.1 sensor domain CHASE2-containing protein [Lutibacter agarilyticus]